MRRDDRVDSLLAECADGEYVFPDYGGYCYAGVPGAALSMLGVDTDAPTLPSDVFGDLEAGSVDTVLVLLLDGLGYDRWCRAEDDDRVRTSMLRALADRGIVTPLTAIFPSETAAAVPTIHTGRYPIEHGQLGWWRYVDAIGAPVQTLPYVTAAGDAVRAVYPDAPASEDVLYDADPIYDRLPGDITTVLFEPADIGRNEAQTFAAGADEYVAHETLAELAVQLRHALETASGRTYLYAYVPQIDTYSHRYGPNSEETTAQLEAIDRTLLRHIGHRLSDEAAERTLLVVCADHGLVDTGGTNIDLRGYGSLWDDLERDPDGRPIPPMGSARQLHLHVRDEAIPRVRDTLERHFDCRTFTAGEYEDDGLFGPVEAGSVYREAAPDLLCVHRSTGMWYDDEGLAKIGKHGGLTRAEMLVPLATARLSALCGYRF